MYKHKTMYFIAVIMLFLIILSSIQVSSEDQEHPPRLPPYVFVKAGKALFIPNETFSEFLKTPDNNGHIIVSFNYSTDIVVFRKLSLDNDIVWQKTYQNMSIMHNYLDGDINGKEVIVALLKNTSNKRIMLKLIDVKDGSEIYNDSIKNILLDYIPDYKSYYYKGELYIEDLNLLIMYLHVNYQNYTVVAYNLSSYSVEWVQTIPNTEVISSLVYWDGNVVAALIVGRYASGFNLTFAEINITTGELYEKILYGNASVYMMPSPSPNPGLVTVIYPAGNDSYIYLFNLTTNTQKTISISSYGITYLEYYKLYWSPNKSYFMIIGYNSTLNNDTILVFNRVGELVASIPLEGNVFESDIKWSPNGDEIFVHYSVPGFYDKMLVYNLTINKIVLSRKIPIITKVAWAPENSRLYLAITPYTAFPQILVYKHNTTGMYELESKSLVFHNYYAGELYLEYLNDTLNIYYVNNVHYDNDYGYWERIFIYRLVQAPVRILARLDQNTYLVGAYGEGYFNITNQSAKEFQVQNTRVSASITATLEYPMYVWVESYDSNNNEWYSSDVYYGTLIYINANSTLSTRSLPVKAYLYMNLTVNVPHHGIELSYSNKTTKCITWYNKENNTLTIGIEYMENLVCQQTNIRAVAVYPLLYIDNPEILEQPSLLDININFSIVNEGTQTSTTTPQHTTTALSTTTTTTPPNTSTTSTETYEHATPHQESSSTNTNPQVTGTESNTEEKRTGNTLLMAGIIIIVIILGLIIVLIKR